MERYVLGHGALASVAKEYTGNGLASAIIIENARQMAADRICNYFYGNPTANETGSVAPKLGMPEVWRLNFYQSPSNWTITDAFSTIFRPIFAIIETKNYEKF
uniref:N-acetyltransferase domain-containing protein n=1 Tax=Bursaphelenchus xylophilus TaxID=6326 RepID=A0A1I7RUS1_BURXY